jgi:hypothetical protein
MTPFVLIIALGAIGLSSLVMRIVIGYLVRPPGAPRFSLRLPAMNPRRIGRRLAEIIFGRRK